jgi:hypothetical protein
LVIGSILPINVMINGRAILTQSKLLVLFSLTIRLFSY